MPGTVAPATTRPISCLPNPNPDTRQTTVQPGSFVWLSVGPGVPVPGWELQTRLSATLPSFIATLASHEPLQRYTLAGQWGSQSFDNRFAMHYHRLTLHDNRLLCPLPRLPARLAQGRCFVEVPRRLLQRWWRHRWLRQREWRRSI